MCQISETFYLGLASFLGLVWVFSIFYGNFSIIMGLFWGLAPW